MIKINLYSTLLILLISFAIVSCTQVVDNSSDSSETGEESENWLIPKDKVLVGAGRDGIPSIDTPRFVSISEIDFLSADDLVLGLKKGDEVKAYPHVIMYYHEIVNDYIGNKAISVTFCPLTGSGIAWDRTIDGKETTFGVSGLIFKNNLIAYDRNTNSYWSQMKSKSVKGKYLGKETKNYQLVEMTWEAWKKAYPNSKVLNGNTGFDRNYSIYPYGSNYTTDNENILFPIYREDDRLERKTLGHGILYNTTSLEIYPIKFFPEKTKIVNRDIGDNNIVLAGNSKTKFVVSYSRKIDDDTILNFQESSKGLPVIMRDNEGNQWNIFGEAVSGPRKGEKLKRIPSYNAYWFAWVDFFGSGPRFPRIASFL